MDLPGVNCSKYSFLLNKRKGRKALISSNVILFQLKKYTLLVDCFYKGGPISLHNQVVYFRLIQPFKIIEQGHQI